MNRKKNLLRIGIVVALMIVGAVIAFVLLPKIYRTEGATQTVAALNCDVTKGTQIQETMVITKAVGAYGLDSSVVTDPAQIIGLYANEDISKKELLYTDKFTDNPSGEALSQNIKLTADEMLVTLELSSVAAGAAGNIVPGDKVNTAVYTFDKTNYFESQNTDRVIFPESLQGLRVYRVLTAQLMDVDKNAEVSNSNNGRIPAYITLICTKDQADLLLDYSYTYTVHFIEEN